MSVMAQPLPPPAAAPYRAALERSAFVLWGIDAPVATFAAQVEQESGWRESARSAAGAEGMAQFMPSTGRWLVEIYPHLESYQPLNPVWSLRALVQYDVYLHRRVSGADACERMAKTLSAYNGGLAWIGRDEKKAQAEGYDPGRWFDHVERVNSGRAPWAFAENRSYPRRILRTLEPKYAAWGRRSCP